MDFLCDWIEEQSVYRKVAALGVCSRICEHNLLRSPAVLIICLSTERGDLELLFAFDHDNDSKLATDGHRALEEFFNLLRSRRGCDVIVPGSRPSKNRRRNHPPKKRNNLLPAVGGQCW